MAFDSSGSAQGGFSLRANDCLFQPQLGEFSPLGQHQTFARNNHGFGRAKNKARARVWRKIFSTSRGIDLGSSGTAQPPSAQIASRSIKKAMLLPCTNSARSPGSIPTCCNSSWRRSTAARKEGASAFLPECSSIKLPRRSKGLCQTVCTVKNLAMNAAEIKGTIGV